MLSCHPARRVGLFAGPPPPAAHQSETEKATQGVTPDPPPASAALSPCRPGPSLQPAVQLKSAAPWMMDRPWALAASPLVPEVVVAL